MKLKISNIFWGLFAWIIGGLFILGGIEHIFFGRLDVYKNYNNIFGVIAIIIGFLIIRAWFKQRDLK